MQIVCDNPRIIINPLLPELLSKYRYYILNGKGDYFRGHNADTNFPYKKFSVKQNVYTEDSLTNSMVIDIKSGESYPIYQKVPCGHCSACQINKQNSYVHRCILETQCYDTKPWFVTLTYNDSHLPLVEIDGTYYPTLSVRDCQLFFKRLRINLQRRGLQTAPIRYSLVGEYGKKSPEHRPHYHAIIWNLNCFTHQCFLDVSKCIEDSWQNGFVSVRLINPEKDNGKTFRYTAKYTHKYQERYYPDCCYDCPDWKDSFHCSSRKNGGIGAPFIDRYKTEKLHKDFKFLNKFTQKCDNFYFNSYVCNRLRPSYSRLVPSFYRNAIKELNYYNRGEYNFELKLLRTENPCYISAHPPKHLDYLHYSSAEECYEVIMNWRNHPKYTDPYSARLRQIEREGFFMACLEGVPEKDIQSYIYKCKNILNRQLSTQII